MQVSTSPQRTSGRIWARAVAGSALLGLAGVVLAAYTYSEVLGGSIDTDGASVSADGTRVAWREFGSGGTSSIKVRYGGTTYTVSGSLDNVGRPRISRDGLYVAFYGATGSGSSRFPYGVKIGNSPVQLGVFHGGDTPPAVSDDLGNGTARYCFYDTYNVPSRIPLGPPEYTSLVVEDAGTSSGSKTPITWYSNHLIAGTEPAITTDGETVFFTSSDEIRVSEYASLTGWTVSSDIVSSGSSGPSNGDSRDASCSADGRYVAFASQGSNLDSGDAGGNFDVFVRDRTAATLTRAYTGSGGSTGIGGWDAEGIEISSDGSYVAFFSGSTDILDLEFCDTMQEYIEETVFVSDWANQSVEAVSFMPDGEGDPACFLNGTFPSISQDADHIGFQSDTPGIVSGDNDGYKHALHKYDHT